MMFKKKLSFIHSDKSMTIIRSDADLRNRYNDISKRCHTYVEPVYIIKNEKGDLAVMSIDTYERMQGRPDLYGRIADGLDDIKTGNTRPFNKAMADIRARRKR